MRRWTRSRRRHRTGSRSASGPIAYTGIAALQRDIDDVKAAIKGADVAEAFLPVAAPASVIPDRKNLYYKNDEEMQEAIAGAMRTEYRTIAESGLLLQLDDARAAVTYDRMVPPASFADYRKWLERQIEILNHAIEGIPQDRIRYHVCWGSWPGPHTTDVPLKDIVDIILKARVGAFLIEGANPRHEHEWRVWENAKLGDGRVLIPGVISHATNIVEHPELIAETNRALCEESRARERHRRHRLRLRAGTVPPPRASLDHVGEVRSRWPKARALASRELWR